MPESLEKTPKTVAETMRGLEALYSNLGADLLTQQSRGIAANIRKRLSKAGLIKKKAELTGIINSQNEDIAESVLRSVGDLILKNSYDNKADLVIDLVGGIKDKKSSLEPEFRQHLPFYEYNFGNNALEIKKFEREWGWKHYGFYRKFLQSAGLLERLDLSAEDKAAIYEKINPQCPGVIQLCHFAALSHDKGAVEKMLELFSDEQSTVRQKDAALVAVNEIIFSSPVEEQPAILDQVAKKYREDNERSTQKDSDAGDYLGWIMIYRSLLASAGILEKMEVDDPQVRRATFLLKDLDLNFLAKLWQFQFVIPGLFKWAVGVVPDGKKLLIENMVRAREKARKMEDQSGALTFEMFSRIASDCGLDINVANIYESSLEEIKDIENEEKLKYLFPDEIKIYKFVQARKSMKDEVFANPGCLEGLKDRQSWISINDPADAEKMVDYIVNETGKRGALDNILKAQIGISVKQLSAKSYQIYADEIIDAAWKIIKDNNLENDEKIKPVVSGLKYMEGTKFRYFSRGSGDLSLGDKCGDCTSKGSVNFGPSLSWLINPAYQVLKITRNGTFIGKVNLAIGNLRFTGRDGELNHQEVILIDALEFNPQAKRGKPLYVEAKTCLSELLGFLKDLAKKQERKLIGFSWTNSSEAGRIMERFGKPVADADVRNDQEKVCSLSFLVPAGEIKRISGQLGLTQPSLFYQSIGNMVSGQEEEIEDEKVPVLESEIINPAQLNNPEIGGAMQRKDFSQAVELILHDGSLVEKIKKIYNIPGQIEISRAFLLARIKKMYPDAKVLVDGGIVMKAYQVKAKHFVELVNGI